MDTTFEQHDFAIDYIAFNLEDLKDFSTMEQIGQGFFWQFGFDFKVLKHQDQEIIKQDPIHETNPIVYLKLYKNAKGCTISFPGVSGRQFYQHIKHNGIPWRLFRTPKNKINLGRLDVCYDQPWTEDVIYDFDRIDDYFKKCREKKKNKVCELTRNNDGVFFKMGARNSSVYFRIYPKDKGLRFEIELKKFNKNLKIVQIVKQYFLTGKIWELEDRLASYFICAFKERVDLDEPEAYWLVKRIRTVSSTVRGHSASTLSSTYVSQQSYHFLKAFNLMKQAYPKTKDSWHFKDDEAFYTFIQLCSFLSKLEPRDPQVKKAIRKDPFDPCEISNVTVEFPLIQFLDYLQIKVTQYQRKKYGTFFKVLPFASTVIHQFDDESFVAAAGFPLIVVFRKNNRLFVRMKILEPFLRYKFPFEHSPYFTTYTNKYDLKVKLMIIRNYNQVSLIKKIPTYQLFEDHKSSSALVRKRLASHFLKSFQELKRKDFIESVCILKLRNKKKFLKEKTENKTLQITISQLTEDHLRVAEFIKIKEKI